ncbi:hypothetical protein KFU94_44970 [Chloroflexi bacterium TSY]|nr:hypothetical protein [Chloroflexi bacterium TSY]
MIREEIQEIRRLLAKVENLICSISKDKEFCRQAKWLRTSVHDTPDPRNVELGVQNLEKGLVQK